MSLLTERRAFLPACLILGTLLCALPILAAPPAAPAAGAAKAQMLNLQNTVPGDILRALHWDQNAQRFDSAATIRVEGVARISALPATNSLSVVATPGGFAKVRDLVRVLDVAPRQVQVKFALANATDADLKASGLAFESAPLPSLLDVPMPDTKYAVGNRAALFLQTLTKQGAVAEAPVFTTSNNVAASLRLTTPAQSQVVSSRTFAVTPRVNSDDSVTLALHPVFLDGAVRREIKTLHTVKNGDTLLIVMRPNARIVGGKSLLLFVTPTILSTGKGPAVMTVK